MIKNIFKLVAMITALSGQSAYADHNTEQLETNPITWENIEQAKSKAHKNSILDFLAREGMVRVFQGRERNTHRITNDRLELYIHPKNNRWILLNERHLTPHIGSSFVNGESSYYAISGFGTYSETNFDNHGKQVSRDQLFSHGLCENIRNPMLFHTASNPIFMGLNESHHFENTLLRIFTQSNGQYSSTNNAHIVRENPNGRCYIMGNTDTVQLTHLPSPS